MARQRYCTIEQVGRVAGARAHLRRLREVETVRGLLHGRVDPEVVEREPGDLAERSSLLNGISTITDCHPLARG